MAALRTLPEALADGCARRRGLPFRRRGGAETPRSYAEICDRSLAVARALARAPGCAAAISSRIVLPDAEQFLTTLFGASIAGLVPASLYPPATTERSAALLRADRQRSCARRRRARSRDVARARAVVRGAARAAARPVELVLVRDDARRAADRAVGRRRRSTTSRSCSSHPVRRRRQKVSRSRTRNLSANIEAFNGPAGVATSADDVGRELAAAESRHGARRHGARRAVYRRGRASCCRRTPFVKRPDRMAARDHPLSRNGQLRAELRLRPVRPPREGSTRRTGPLVAGASPAAAPSRFIRRRSPRSRRSSRRPDSATPAFFRATAWPSTCWRRPSRRAAARPRVETIAADDLTERRVATPHQGDGPAPSRLSAADRRCRITDLRIVGEDGRPLSRSAQSARSFWPARP